MKAQEALDLEEGEALDSEQDEEHRRGGTRQPRIGLDPALDLLHRRPITVDHRHRVTLGETLPAETCLRGCSTDLYQVFAVDGRCQIFRRQVDRCPRGPHRRERSDAAKFERPRTSVSATCCALVALRGACLASSRRVEPAAW